MKIFTNNCVYVQKNDIAFLNQMDDVIPASIFLKVFGGGVTIIDDRNRFEFVKFNNVREIEYFKNIDCILDYDLVKDLNESEIIGLGMEVAKEKNDMIDRYSAMNEEERKLNKNIYVDLEKYDYKMDSIRTFLWYRRGNVKFNLPKGIENTKSESKGRKRILSKFRNKKK